jgi:hypothetical protein
VPATSSASSFPGRLRARRALAGAAIVVGALGIGACSSPAPSQGDLSAALVDSGLSKKVADCASKALTESLTKNELAELTERGAGGAPVDDPKDTNDSYDKLQKAMAVCRDLQARAAPSTTVAPATDGTSTDGTSTTVTIADGTEGAELNPASTTTATP